MKLTRSMSSGELIVMLTAYKLLIEKKCTSHTDLHFNRNWVASIINNTNFEHIELVEIYKRSLIKKEICIKADYDQNAIGDKHSNGLTSLGLGLCKYISTYETI